MAKSYISDYVQEHTTANGNTNSVQGDKTKQVMRLVVIQKHRAANRLSVSLVAVRHIASLSGGFWVSYRSPPMVRILFGLVMLSVRSLIRCLIVLVFLVKAWCWD